MNRKLIIRIVGLILCIEALFLVLPLGVALISHGPDVRAFALSVLICFAAGALLALSAALFPAAQGGAAAAALLLAAAILAPFLYARRLDRSPLGK